MATDPRPWNPNDAPRKANKRRWEPTEGDTLRGLVRGYGEGNTQYGVKPLVMVKAEPGDVLYTVWLSAKALQRQFEDLAPNVGSLVEIQYYGKDSGTGYHRYSLDVLSMGDGREYRSSENQLQDATGYEPPKLSDFGACIARAPKRSDKQLAIEAIHRNRQRKREGNTSAFHDALLRRANVNS